MRSLTLAFCSLAFLISTAQRGEAVDFNTQVKPLLEGTCIHCHGEKKQEGEYRMDQKAFAFAGGETYPEETIIPNDPMKSAVYWMTAEPADSSDIMPPKIHLTVEQQNVIKAWIEAGAEWPEGVVLEEKPHITFKNNILPLLSKGGPFSDADKDILRLWVEQGAVWPADVKLGGDAPADDGSLKDNTALVEKIREVILTTSTEKAEGDMKDYTSEIPKTGVKFDMVAIKGGEFLMGSPAEEANRFEDEGPQHPVKVSPFWMGKFEVTWDMYEPFMITSTPRNKDGSPSEGLGPDAALVDAVSSPTTPYVEMSFGMGTNGYPAISMTEHAASKFCQWLSAQTGHYYRLPTEAEWEYACRAGTTGPYSCPEAELGDYAVLDPTQERSGYEKVGTKKPNPWGLYDMHGNVVEWCLDQFLPDVYASRTGTAMNPLEIPTQLYPRVARGGSWYDPAEELRSARRLGSDENWKIQDPQLPKSIWYHTDAQWLGFRIVRPLEVPDLKTMDLLWNMGRTGA